MLTDPEERFVVSSLGWVDQGGIWIYQVSSGTVNRASLGDAKYVSLHGGVSGHFAAMQHFDEGRITLSAHSFAQPDSVVGTCSFSNSEFRFSGDPKVWQFLPRYFVAYLSRPGGPEFGLLSVGPGAQVTFQTFEWYDDSYDKGYQGIIGVRQIPDSDLVLVSVQRSSTLIIYSPTQMEKVGEIQLCGRHGNPSLHFDRRRGILWADDYDTLVQLELGTWRIKRHRRLQDAADGTGRFIGQFTSDRDESICAVARPFSGDVIGLDPANLKTKYRADLGRQPLEVALLSDRKVVARDWMSGDLLEGRLRRTWR